MTSRVLVFIQDPNSHTDHILFARKLKTAKVHHDEQLDSNRHSSQIFKSALPLNSPATMINFISSTKASTHKEARKTEQISIHF
jgi:hypothetical protein